MDDEHMRQIADEAVKTVNDRMDKFIASEAESRRVMSNLLDRLTAVVAGDKEFSQPGLVQTVGEHTKAIADIQKIKTEATASVRAVLFIGGGIITIINLVIRFYGH